MPLAPCSVPHAPRSKPHAHGFFAEPIRATAPVAAANPFGFSTKSQDAEADLLYYGYLYYSPSLGRWLSRDPLGELSFPVPQASVSEEAAVEIEEPGVAIQDSYLYVRNDAGHGLDGLGLFEVESEVERVQTPFRIPIEAHYFLRVEGISCGLWPKGGKKKLLSLLPFMWVKARVYSPDLTDEAQAGSPVKLDPCAYDLEKFKTCVKAACYAHDSGLYNLIVRNCYHWREAVLDRCARASKRRP